MARIEEPWETFIDRLTDNLSTHYLNIQRSEVVDQFDKHPRLLAFDELPDMQANQYVTNLYAQFTREYDIEVDELRQVFKESAREAQEELDQAGQQTEDDEPDSITGGTEDDGSSDDDDGGSEREIVDDMDSSGVPDPRPDEQPPTRLDSLSVSKPDK